MISALRCSELTGRLTDSLADPVGEMEWCRDEEIVLLAKSIRQCGAGFLNPYRCAERNWSLWGAWSDLVPKVPAQFIYGNKEVSLRFPGRGDAADEMVRTLPAAFPSIKLEGDVGHWCQLEQPEQVNIALLNFFARIGW